VSNHSKFILPSAPQTPLRPETGFTDFTMTSYKNNTSRLNTGFTELGVDEYLLNESKKNNEYLQFTSNNNTRVHTPNIFRIDSLERDLIVDHEDKYTRNAMEKSIKSKSDFLYNFNVITSKEEDVNNQQQNYMEQQIEDENKDDVVNQLLAKNKNRLKYFRSATPLDSTRSMKIGLQKIEDLLTENEKLNGKYNRNKNKKKKKNRNNYTQCFDDSLYELM